MNVVICALARNENQYINDWVNWYVSLGFDKIYLYDNNDVDSPFVGDYIERKDKVKIINIRGQHFDRLQQKVYTDFYNNNTFDWVLFVDIDEYLTGIDNIHDFLRKHKQSFQIRIKWKLFGDDNLIERDMSIPVYKAFTKEVTQSLNRNLVDKGNLERQGKMIIKGGLPNVIITSPHFGSFKTRNNVIPSVLPSGRLCFSKVAINEFYGQETVYINHYMTKSLSEFIKQKWKRTDAVYGDISIDFNYFWRINQKTQEKLDYIKKVVGYEQN